MHTYPQLSIDSFTALDDRWCPYPMLTRITAIYRMILVLRNKQNPNPG